MGSSKHTLEADIVLASGMPVGKQGLSDVASWFNVLRKNWDVHMSEYTEAEVNNPESKLTNTFKQLNALTTIEDRDLPDYRAACP